MPPELRTTDALPDQIASPQFGGTMVTKVPFLHPGKIFNIIMVSISFALCDVVTSLSLSPQLLRKQLVYNTLISSCLGRSRKTIPPPTSPEVTECIFEVSSMPPSQVTIAMDLQSDKSMIGKQLMHHSKK